MLDIFVTISLNTWHKIYSQWWLYEDNVTYQYEQRVSNETLCI